MQGTTPLNVVMDETLTPMERLSVQADAGVTLAGRMAVALTLVRNKNSRVLGGTALQSPIFAGLDNDLEPEHRAARQDARRKARRVQRTARKVHRK